MIDLTKYLTSEEINEFYNICKQTDNFDLGIVEKNQKFNNLFIKWLSSLSKEDEFVDAIMKKQWNDLRRIYKKAIEPYVLKGYKFVPILGTLLGPYRDGKFISHDDDLDIAIDVNEFNRISKKIKLRAIFNGWHSVEKGWFRNGYNHNKTGDKLIQFYRMRMNKFKIGDYTFKTKGQFDIWPLIKEPSEETREKDRNLYQVHIYNILRKNGIKYSSIEQKLSQIDNNYTDFAIDLWNDNDSKKISCNWIDNLYLRGINSNSVFYMPLERDMHKILNFKIGELKEIDGLKMYWPLVSDINLEHNYGDWKTPRKTHLHLVKFHTIKRRKK